MRDEKEERNKQASKVKQTNKARQHSTPKAVAQYYLSDWCTNFTLMMLLLATDQLMAAVLFTLMMLLLATDPTHGS